MDAASNSAVAAVLHTTVQYYKQWTSAFVDVITRAPLPYCVRYMGRVMSRALHAPDRPIVGEHDVLKVCVCTKCGGAYAAQAVGQVVFDDYIYPMIVNPTFTSTTPNLTATDRKKLSSIAKMLRFSTANKGVCKSAQSLNAISLFSTATSMNICLV
jgi:hypothetical protein